MREIDELTYNTWLSARPRAWIKPRLWFSDPGNPLPITTARRMTLYAPFSKISGTPKVGLGGSGSLIGLMDWFKSLTDYQELENSKAWNLFLVWWNWGGRERSTGVKQVMDRKRKVVSFSTELDLLLKCKKKNLISFFQAERRKAHAYKNKPSGVDLIKWILFTKPNIKNHESDGWQFNANWSE